MVGSLRTEGGNSGEKETKGKPDQGGLVGKKSEGWEAGDRRREVKGGRGGWVGW